MTDTAAPCIPGWIRLYATSDMSHAGRIALEYAKSLLRIAPVRALPAAGIGMWPGYESLSNTAMTGTWINVVAAAPDHWVRMIRVAVPARPDPFVGDKLSSSWQLEHGCRTRGVGADVIQKPLPVAETLTERVELWTANVRNVLIAIGTPKDQFQLATARKYDVVITPTCAAAHLWKSLHGITTTVIEVPVIAHGALRAAVLGIPDTETETKTDTKEQHADQVLR